MSPTWVDAIIRNPFTGRTTAVKAVVNTGTTLSAVPRKLQKSFSYPL
jgi:hypothetical protein